MSLRRCNSASRAARRSATDLTDILSPFMKAVGVDEFLDNGELFLALEGRFIRFLSDAGGNRIRSIVVEREAYSRSFSFSVPLDILSVERTEVLNFPERRFYLRAQCRWLARPLHVPKGECQAETAGRQFLAWDRSSGVRASTISANCLQYGHSKSEKTTSLAGQYLACR